MTANRLTPTTDPLQTVVAAKDCLAALQQSLSSLVSQNGDASFRLCIAESLSRCVLLDGFLDRLSATQSGQDAQVDPQTFERLMTLAGADTAIELLDQVLIDLRRGHQIIEDALPADDRTALRSQCHMLVAVAGAIGATAVQANADHLNSATLYADQDTLAVKVAQLQTPLQALIRFVQRERQARIPG